MVCNLFVENPQYSNSMQWGSSFIVTDKKNNNSSLRRIGSVPFSAIRGDDGWGACGSDPLQGDQLLRVYREQDPINLLQYKLC